VGGRLGALTPYGFRVRTSVLLLATMAFALGLGPAAHAAPRVTFYFGLERPEGSARVAWNAVGDPRSATYRHFLSAPLVARRYGASASTIRRFRRGVRRRGLGVQVDRSRVFARVTGTVPAFEDLLDIRLRKQFNNDVNANGWFAAGKRPPRPPRGLRPLVREIVTSYSRSTRPPTASSAQATPQPGNAGTWTEGCDAARATGAYAFGQVRNAYGVPPGTGARVAILNAGEGAPQRDVDTAGACFGLPGLHTRTLLTDGQSKPFGRGTFEPRRTSRWCAGWRPGSARPPSRRYGWRPSCGSSAPRGSSTNARGPTRSPSHTASASATSEVEPRRLRAAPARTCSTRCWCASGSPA
jgi:hypothetical protein